MKLAPIYNPHSKVGQVMKKTKAEEKDEFLMKTKTTVLDKYGKKSMNNRFTQHKQNMTGTGTNNFQQKDDFKLEEKVTAKSESIKLMQKGYVQAYVDFFYITTETTPSEIEPNKSLKDDVKNQKKKQKFQHTETSLIALSEDLMSAEEHHRNGQTEKCLDRYRKVAKDFQGMLDYETASYFYKKCLDVSVEAGFLKGEAQAYQGLGICEENVENIYYAMNHLETAL